MRICFHNAEFKYLPRHLPSIFIIFYPGKLRNREIGDIRENEKTAPPEKGDATVFYIMCQVSKPASREDMPACLSGKGLSFDIGKLLRFPRHFPCIMIGMQKHMCLVRQRFFHEILVESKDIRILMGEADLAVFVQEIQVLATLVG